VAARAACQPDGVMAAAIAEVASRSRRLIPGMVTSYRYAPIDLRLYRTDQLRWWLEDVPPAVF
jgi:hypothetical protein